jgi:hypothetical protein
MTYRCTPCPTSLFLSSIICPLSSVIRSLSSVLCHPLSVICFLPSVLCHLLSVLCFLPSVLCPLFRLPHSDFRIQDSLPSVLCHQSSVICHPSSVIRHLFFRCARILAIINPIPMGCISPDFNFLSVFTNALAGGESTCFLR